MALCYAALCGIISADVAKHCAFLSWPQKEGIIRSEGSASDASFACSSLRSHQIIARKTSVRDIPWKFVDHERHHPQEQVICKSM